jgi:hypothetical protein
VIRVAVAALALSLAPIQCTHEPDPALRREDPADEALWNLAKDFDARGDDAAARHTLEVLVARYPSSRFALGARERLDGGVPIDAALE